MLLGVLLEGDFVYRKYSSSERKMDFFFNQKRCLKDPYRLINGEVHKSIMKEVLSRNEGY